ncbi:hypothetical protein [Alicyclobacillus sp. SO9]|uniref:hypothetical protein n=1 Tax=Alicyclobacillus sp. SO9 TaxID=2665646 RepID=UPI0018E7431D|nr:hypothetical protein [Alicyclobacillus sp. SO9]QQE77134.1 hypothetical protein GI364_14245 [Alicyclobacillus sp. SO9]
MRHVQVVFSYWSTMVLTLIRPRFAEQHIDIQLEEALNRSRWYTAWSTIIWAFWLYTTQHRLWIHWLSHQAGIVSPGWQWLMTLFVVFISLPVTYGLFRLYILLTHVVTLNVFKVRGQRLRLLNLETTMLTLSGPTVVGLAVMPSSESIGNLILAICIIYAGWMTARGYNHIFHKTRVKGFLLFVGATLVTGFIAAMAGVALAATLGVLGFFLLLILRSFTH